MQMPAPWSVGEQVADRYVVRVGAGAGPLGPRYLASDPQRGADVMLRVVRAELLPDDESRRAFRERLSRSRALGHPGLLRLVEVVEHGGLVVSAVEHAPGPTLGELVAQRGALPWSEARPLLGMVAAAVTHANQLAVVLGDLRPGAVVVAGETARVTSLGVALALPRERYLGAMAQDAELPHLPPELRRGAYCDARADLYSFGALALALLCGTDLESARAGQRLGVPVSLLSVLERALDPDPARRPATVEALLAALDRASDEARPRRGPVTLPPSITRSTGPIAIPSLIVDEGALVGQTIPSMPATQLSSPSAPTVPAMAAEPAEPAPAAEPAQPNTQAPPASPTIPTMPTVPGMPTVPPPHLAREAEDELRRLAGEVSDILENTRQTEPSFEVAPPLEATRQLDLQALEALRARSAAPDAESVPEPILLSGGRTREPTIRYPVPRREPTGRVVVARIGGATLTSGENVPSRLQREPTPRGLGGPVPSRIPGREATPTPRLRRDSTPLMVPAVPPARARSSDSTDDEYALFEVARGPGHGASLDDTFDEEAELRITDVRQRPSAVEARRAQVMPVARPETASPPSPASPAGDGPGQAAERASDAATDPAQGSVSGVLTVRSPDLTAAETPWARRVAAIPVDDETDVSSLDLEAGPGAPRPDELAVTDRMPSVPPGEASGAGTGASGAGAAAPKPSSGPLGIIREPLLFAPRPPDPFAEALEAHDAQRGGAKGTGPVAAVAAPGPVVGPPPGAAPVRRGPERPPTNPELRPVSSLAPPAPRSERPTLLVLDDSDPSLAGSGTVRAPVEQTPVVVRAAPAPPARSRGGYALFAIGLGCLVVALGAGVAWRRSAAMGRAATANVGRASPVAAAGTGPAVPVVPPPPHRVAAELPAPAPSPAAPAPTPSPVADQAGATVEMVEVNQRGRHFFIDAYEFPGKARLPRVNVSLDEARAACAARAARLCASAEFELACRGERRASFPYGSQYEAGVCNTEQGTVEPSGSFSDCRSAAGAFDMSGNVAEWTAAGIVKGGAVGGGFVAARCSRDLRGDGKPSPSIGFRCCKDAD